VPEPPGRFSMTIDCPRCFSVAAASARMPTSVVPPAGHGTMRVTGRTGKFCACAAPIHATNPAASTMPYTMRFMGLSWRRPQIMQGT
jgi:hypothetical protein